MKPRVSKMADGRWQCKGYLPTSVNFNGHLLKGEIEAIFYGATPAQAADNFADYKKQRALYYDDLAA